MYYITHYKVCIIYRNKIPSLDLTNAGQIKIVIPNKRTIQQFNKSFKAIFVVCPLPSGFLNIYISYEHF